MWADALLRAEQLHILRVLAWAALAALVGTALAVVGTMLRHRPVVLRAFGGWLAAMGAAEIIVAALAYRSAGLTDAAGAARLQNLAWLELGVFAGGAFAGILVAAVARQARMPRALGAAIALAVHGAALVALTAAFVPVVSR